MSLAITLCQSEENERHLSSHPVEVIDYNIAEGQP